MILSFDPGMRHLGVCCLSTEEPEQQQREFKLHCWVLLDVLQDGNLSQSIRELHDTLLQSTRANKLDLEDVTRVVIERQPPSNAASSRMQHWLEMWCMLHCPHAQTEVMNAQSRWKQLTRCIPASMIHEAEASTAHITTAYRKRKLMAVSIAKSLVSKHPNGTLLMEQHKKQDDLADAFLQAYVLHRDKQQFTKHFDK